MPNTTYALVDPHKEDVAYYGNVQNAPTSARVYDTQAAVADSDVRCVRELLVCT